MLPTHKKGLYIIEQCRVMVKDHKLCWVSAEKDWYRYFAIPVANTTVVMLGNGTSITQSAVRMLAEQNIILGFTGTGGTPLLMTSQQGAEYRPSEYCQRWVKVWFDDHNRLEMAKICQEKRIAFVNQQYKKRLNEALYAETLAVGERYQSKIDAALGIPELMGYEGEYAKSLYRINSKQLGIDGFKREPGKKDADDLFNSFIDHGNYLAYGLAASALWTLGIPFAFPVMHGKTRRGALIFDIADIIKDAVVLPVAMETAAAQESDQEARRRCVKTLNTSDALAYMINSIKFILDEIEKTEENDV